MAEKSKSNSPENILQNKISALQNQPGPFFKKAGAMLEGFVNSYRKVLRLKGEDLASYIPLFSKYIELVQDQILHPFIFSPFHKKVTHPFNYHQFGIDFFKPLIDLKRSSVHGLYHLESIQQHIEQGHNVVLFANHQIEADPQAIYILLEPFYQKLADQMIFVAGDRVVTDPLAVPFSKGCNLLCIYSKRYIDIAPDLKAQKLKHNQKTMQLMSDLLSQGGQCIYVAPSGGRDRMNEEGNLLPALFDPQSIEMFFLMSKKSKVTTYFYPLALSTYQILPPPETIQVELGEIRNASYSPIHLSFGNHLDMENYPGMENQDKSLRRKARSDYIHDLVCELYHKITHQS